MPQETSEGFYLHHLPRMALLQDFLPGATVLLLGAGVRYDAEVLLGLGASRVVCVSPESFQDSHPQDAHPSSSEGITFLQAEYHRLPLADHQFDIVLAFEALTAHPALPRAIAELKRVLTPEGFIAIASPNFARDDLREIMGEGERRYAYRSPSELYETLLDQFEHVTPLSQAPFLGYTLLEHRDTEEPRPFNISYDLLGGRAENPLFYLFLAADLEIVLEEDRLIQVPFSHLVDRIQEGLRLFHRSLERKNSALLELREELALLRRDTDLQRETSHRLRNQLTRLVDRLQTLTRDLEPLLRSPSEGSREVVEGVRRLRERVNDLLAGIEPEQPSRPGAGALPGAMSRDEGRLLAEGLRGQAIGEQLRRLESAPVSDLRLPQGRPAPRVPSGPVLPSDPIFQEDLAPFRLPGPVSLSASLRQDLAETRELLHQREAEMRQLLSWRDDLLAQVGQLEAGLRRTLGTGPNNWQLRQAVTHVLDSLAALLREPALEAIRVPAPEHAAVPAPAEGAGEQTDQAELFRALMALHAPEAAAPGGAGTSADRQAWEAEIQALRDRAGELEDRLGALQTETDAVRGREQDLQHLNARLQAQLDELYAREQALEAARAAEAGSRPPRVEEQVTEEQPIPVLELELESREQALSARAAELAVLEEALAAREDALRERLEALTAREQALVQQEEGAGARFAELAALEAAVEARDTALTAREAELTSRQEALQTRHDELAVFEQALETRTLELESYAQQLAALREDLVTREMALTSQIAEREALIVALQTDLGALEVRLREADRRARQAEAARRALEERQAGLDQQIAAIQQAGQELEAARGEVQTEHAALEQQQHALEQLQQELEAAHGAAAGSEQAITNLREELAAAQQTAAERAQANEELDARIQALYRQRETLENEVEQARQQAARQMQAAAGLDVLETELEELRGQLTRQQTELEELRASRESAAELAAAIAELQEKLATQEASATHAVEEASTADARRQELEKLLAEREAEILELKEEVQRAWKRSLEGGRADLAGVEQAPVESISAVAEPMSDVQARLDTQREQLENLQKQLDSRNILLTRLQKELELKSTHNRNLQEIIGKQREDLDKIKGKIREAIEYIGRLHQSNQEKDQELDNLRKQLGRNDNPPMHS